MDILKVYLFNAPRFEYQGAILDVPRRKSIALVAYLAITQQPQSRDTIATLLWPELDQERARGALRSALHSLTSLFPHDVFTAKRDTLVLNKEAIWVDVRAFHDCLAQRRTHTHPHDIICETCVRLFEEALDLYQDDFLAGFSLNDSAEYDEWQGFQREALRRECGEILRQLAGYYGDKRIVSYEVALGYARRWLSLDPLHEPAHRMLMRLYTANGQRAEALRQYQECVDLLNDELATPPEEETTALYEEIRSEGTVPSHTAPPIGTLPPLPGLVVGRETVLQDLKRRIGINPSGEMRPITVIQGWPGVGKSTLVAALSHDAEIPRAFPDGVLWASLGENPNLLPELLTWAKALQVVDNKSSFALEEISSILTAALRDRRMLIILDDVWQTEHVTPFRVGGQNCVFIVTSRLNEVARALAPTPQDIYRLALLTEESGLQLLAALAPQAVNEYPDESRELIRNLEGLPLAIQVAGRLLDSEMQLGWGVSDLLGELREGTRLLKAQAPGDMMGRWNDTTPTIAALLRRSTDALDPQTRQRFGDLGLFVPKPATFDLQAMAALWDVDDPKPTARILVNRGLLEPLSGGRFQMHALLVLHARALLESHV